MNDLARRLDEIKGYLDGTDKGQWEALKVIDEAVAALSTDAEPVKTSRFGHHPEPSIDFCIEVEALEGHLFDAKHGIGKPGHEPRKVDDDFRRRVSNAMDFIVGGDQIAIAAKATLRALSAQVQEEQPATLPVTVREERMHPGMVKYHIEGLPRAVVIHHFTTTDGGPPHDHPWSFQSTVLAGGYVERVHQLDGSSETVHRQPEDTFEIAAKHIHRIEELPTGECWTLILPREHEQTSGFYEFREDGAWQRRWNEPEWSKVKRS